MPRITTSDQLCVDVCAEMFNRESSLRDMATALNSMGYTSKSGITITESHVSNFLRKDLGLRKMKDHAKRYYGEFNHSVCERAKSDGLWALKIKVDEADKKGEANPAEWLTETDWSQIATAGLEWVQRFHQYIVRLATT